MPSAARERLPPRQITGRNMRRIAIGVTALATIIAVSGANAAEKVRLAYAVQVHTANMMVLDTYARKHGIEIETVPMRRYADIQLALMTNQVDVAAFGYGNIGLMEEQGRRDYRVIAGVFTGGYGITLAQGVKADTWKDLEGL
jgi:ABC-type nitrate/sulfonate/bicarbonate transport system substrate-binding protein